MKMADTKDIIDYDTNSVLSEKNYNMPKLGLTSRLPQPGALSKLPKMACSKLPTSIFTACQSEPKKMSPSFEEPLTKKQKYNAIENINFDENIQDDIANSNSTNQDFKIKDQQHKPRFPTCNAKLVYSQSTDMPQPTVFPPVNNQIKTATIKPKLKPINRLVPGGVGGGLSKAVSCMVLPEQKHNQVLPQKQAMKVVSKMTTCSTSNSINNLNSAGNVKNKRPAWDTKGRLQDMEDFMMKNKEVNMNLQNQILSSNERIALLEAEKLTLAGTVQQKEQQTTDATGRIENLINKIKKIEEEKFEEASKYKRQLEELEDTLRSIRRQKEELEGNLKISKEENLGLKISLASVTSARVGIEAELSATKLSLNKKEEQIREHDLEIKSLKIKIEDYIVTIDNANQKLRNEETTRRILHNTIQELKGNIRVFSRVRPLLGDELLGVDTYIPAHIHFPDDDHKILEIEKLADISPNESVASVRKGSNNKYEFSFDRVFDPTSTQQEVFEEISQLVQSALDGYNVCIFAYGQTGSGKTFTMEGIGEDETRGMIKRSVEKIFETKEMLAEKGWKYDFEVSVLEIYNETIRDLLNNKFKEDLKHEIRLVGPNTNEVYVTDLTSFNVTTQEKIKELLIKASENRSVAETKCNERSSRSHSIFRMKITGKNSITSETSCGLLNLIDLAGSERLKDSGSQGQRLKETQNINKSLANLSNVILALANKDQHIPYRNSKLTHLLQNCLGGSSKMLMFVNVSPKEECFQETLNSLRFAVKVNDCNIGTAQKKIK